MSNLKSSNLVMANRSIPAGNTIANSAAKTYFASNRFIAAGTSPLDAVWMMRCCGSFKTALVAPTVAFSVEINRSVIIPTTGPLLPAANITKEQWEIEFGLTKGDAVGTLIANGRAGMAALLGGSLTLRSMMGGLITGVDFNSDLTIEVSVQWGAASANNSITLEQMIWQELRNS